MSTSSLDPANEFYIVDFDRTLVDTDKLNEVFGEIADSYGAISREQLMQADADMKRIGDSLATAGYVRDHLNNVGRSDEWAALEKQFIHESRSLNYLLPGAAELLEWLAARGKRYGIITYGDPLWQRLKLTAAGFKHIPHIIMEQKEKGRFISSWRLSDGTFRLPDAFKRDVVERVVMIDDKAVSFTEFPSGPSKGFWVLDPSHELPSQQGEVPVNVVRVSSLVELIEHL